MDKPKVTPKDFFLWAGAMIALYASVVAFISLLFSYLNYIYPDALTYYSGDPYSSGVSYEMASLIVLVPIFLAISHVIIKSIKADPTRESVWVRRWAIYLTLFAAAAMIAGDLITLIMYFFNGDTTLRFVLKVLVVLLVAVGIFLYYLADLRGYWYREVAKARLVRWAAGALVLVTIGAGFFIIGTPWEARQYRFDEQRVSDLQNIQYQIINYWQTKQKIPASLEDLLDPLYGVSIPQDPKTGVAYEYAKTGGFSFELCATFDAPTRPSAKDGRVVPMGATFAPAPVGPITTNDVWQHSAGRTCFERTIDPERYPPLTKQVL
ncbi:MAG: DUF5671 domain-containing protein [bacterium]|nr:DUF5671 domain-containing protein [bacterium]